MGLPWKHLMSLSTFKRKLNCMITFFQCLYQLQCQLCNFRAKGNMPMLNRKKLSAFLLKFYSFILFACFLILQKITSFILLKKNVNLNNQHLDLEIFIFYLVYGFHNENNYI